MAKRLTVGGQALIEGVMMRGPEAIAMAVRAPDGEIVVKTEAFRSRLDRFPMLNIPILRGSVALFEMLGIGTRALQFSATIADPVASGAPKSASSKWSSLLSLAAAFGVALIFFFVGPLFIVSAGLDAKDQAMEFNLAAGLIRVIFFLAYLLAISMMKDIYRVFQYHGAEHVCVYAFENNDPLTVEHARKYDTPHPRCGTSFLAFVLVVSILTFSLIDSIYIAVVGPMNFLTRMAVHIPFIPIIAGLSYELIRWSGKFFNRPLARIFMKPGLWLQRITTKPPDDSQIEVGLAALKAALGPSVLADYEKGQIAGQMSMHECKVEDLVIRHD